MRYGTLLRAVAEYATVSDVADELIAVVEINPDSPISVPPEILITNGSRVPELSNKPIAKLEKSLAKLEHIDNAKLAWFMQNLGLVEDWIAAVRGRVEAELFAGREVPGFKIVAGKRGNRKWDNESLAEKAMIEMEVAPAEMYRTKLISPADAEKALKKKQPAKWAKLSELITQSEGSPSVAPSTDPRPALSITAIEDDFDVIENNA